MSLVGSLRNCLKSHGEFCGSQPWEVILGTLTFLLCVLSTLEGGERSLGGGGGGGGLGGISVPLRILSLLHAYYRFKKIDRIGSNLVLGVALVYALGSALLAGVAAGPDAAFSILLLADMPKVTRLAQFALSSSTDRRVGENLGRGMYVLAPSLALDTLLKVFLALSVQEIPILAHLARSASFAILLNFLVYLTFYPSTLSLVLELVSSPDGRARWDVRRVIDTLPKEEGQNPVVHRVRILASAGLALWFITKKMPFVLRTESPYYSIFLENATQILIVVFVALLTFKYLFKQDLDEAVELRKTYVEELTRKLEDSESDCSSQRGPKDEMDRASQSTDEGIGLGKGVGSANGVCKRSKILVIGDDSSSESAWSEVYLPDLKDQEAQTTDCLSSSSEEDRDDTLSDEGNESPVIALTHLPSQPRSIEKCLIILKESSTENGPCPLTDEEILNLVEEKHIRSHTLEKILNDHLRGVEVRRKLISRQGPNFKRAFESLPYRNYDYHTVMGACCESVVGYMPVPVGVVGPLKLDDKWFHIPMATTEGCLVASTNRGCSALSRCGGVSSQVTDDGMSRGPVVRFPSAKIAKKAKDWMEDPSNYQLIKSNFDSTSRFARLNKLKVRMAGRLMYLRFVARTGDAMGMNMLSKATEFALNKILDFFPEMQIVSISGNMCTDKKPAAINWIEGRGKSVVCEAVIPASVVETLLKTTTAALVDLNSAKNQTGSAMAGSIGGFNAHAANIVTAIFIATGQDAAQNVVSSNCMTLMEAWGPDGKDLYINCTMPSIEVGTIGGGTVLGPQSACLEMLGVKGPHSTSPGENSRQLARVICGAVLAGELSLMSALAAGHLVRSHLRHNRSSIAVGQLSTERLKNCENLCPDYRNA